MIVQVAVSAATFAIDKPYSYRVSEGMPIQPGQRVQLPFGRGNRPTEGVVLTVSPGDDGKLKEVTALLDPEPILTDRQLRLAAFLRERYFCTFYDAIRAMLPGGVWFRQRVTVCLTEDRSWQQAVIRKEGARQILELLEQAGGQAEAAALERTLPEEELKSVLGYLSGKKWISTQTDYLRRLGDKTEKIAALRFRRRRLWPTPPADPNRRPCRKRCWSCFATWVPRR